VRRRVRHLARTSQLIDTARHRVDDRSEDVAELEQDLADAIAEIDAEWTAKAAEVEQVEVPLEKSDVAVTDLTVVWIPT